MQPIELVFPQNLQRNPSGCFLELYLLAALSEPGSAVGVNITERHISNDAHVA